MVLYLEMYYYCKYCLEDSLPEVHLQIDFWLAAINGQQIVLIIVKSGKKYSILFWGKNVHLLCSLSVKFC